MFSHICIGINDFDRALAFYRPLMQALGIRERFCDPSRPWAGWQSEPGLRPHYHAHYYGAYFRDPDGNKLCVACHEAEGQTV